MHIAYMKPLSKAWNRMVKVLFRPFDMRRWFILGFTSFLAGLLDSHGGGSSHAGRSGHPRLHDILNFPGVAMEWLKDHPNFFALIVFGILCLIALLVVLTWLSSRGKFMFLDNVVTNKDLVVKPWYQFKNLGNSLFLWRLGFGLIVCIVIAAFMIIAFGIAGALYFDRASVSEVLLPIIGMVFLFLLAMILIGYVSLFLNDFIVPIMYKQNLTVNRAWKLFLPLIKKHFLYFLLYGILVFLLNFVVVIGVVTVGLMTCCVGFILLAVPYISAVILLPIAYVFRVFSLEFLCQFDRKWALLR